MKTNLLLILQFILFYFIVLSCNKNAQTESDIFKNVIPVIIDSISHKYEKISKVEFHILDTFLKPLDSISVYNNFLNKNGIVIKEIEKQESYNTALQLYKDNLNTKNGVNTVSSFTNFGKIQQNDSIQHILLAFSRIYINREKNVGFFILLEYLNPKAAREYIVMCVKKSNIWIVKRMYITGIG